MIPLHRLTQPDRPVYVNPDLIQAVEATPDTVIAMTNGSKLVVAECAETVIELICGWRATIYQRALGLDDTPPPAPEPTRLASVVHLATVRD
jgi:flagellar protein FlbD